MTNLKHRIKKFFQCEPLTLLAHLYYEYGTITSSNLTTNFDRMIARWNPLTPISDLFQHHNDGKDSAEEGNEIINNIQLLHLCYYNVHASGNFIETLKTWRKKLDIDKTYANFFPFMTQQEEDRLNNKPTSGTAGFSNNMLDSIVHEKMEESINQM